jgi:glycosyltransferase involved in cell wall biosynthesis
MRFEPGEPRTIRMIEPDMPQLSVVIPAFNAARYIEQAVRSALTQTDLTVEVIVVDDGSTDETAARAGAIDSERVQVRSQPNRGPAAARNAGVRVATGEFLAFLDADDWLELEWGREVIDRLRSGAAIAVSDAHIVGPDGAVSGRYYDELVFPSAAVQSIRILQDNFILSTACVRRDAFAGVGGFDESRRGVEDWDLWIRLVGGGEHAALVPDALSNYRRGHASVSSDVVAMKRAEIALLRRHRGTGGDLRHWRARRQSLLRRQVFTYRMQRRLRSP